MKFTPGPLAADLSGSIGSTTASRNRFGPYFRTKAIPVNPNTTRQQTVRALFATFVTIWNDTLTQAQRDAWNLWADNTPILGKDGSPINITGQNAYVRYNVARGQITEARVDTAPTVFNNGNPVTSFAQSVSGTVGSIGILIGNASTTINISGGASVDGDMSIFLGGPVNPSREFFKGPYQLTNQQPFITTAIGIIWTTAIATMTHVIPLAAGQFRSIRFRMIYDDGRLSDKFEQLATVVEDV